MAEPPQEWIEELDELPRSPSVSADPELVDEVVRAAEWVRHFIRASGDYSAMTDCAPARRPEPRASAPGGVFVAWGLADHATGTSIDVNAASYVR